MAVQEYVEDGARVHHYSDKRLRIRQIETGMVYDAATDVLPCCYTYEETDEQIEDSAAATAEDYEAALARLGVVET